MRAAGVDWDGREREPQASTRAGTAAYNEGWS